MVKFRFFVHCEGWRAGGYENAHFAENEKEAKRIVDGWNGQKRPGDDGYVELLSTDEITVDEFVADYIPAFL